MKLFKLLFPRQYQLINKQKENLEKLQDTIDKHDCYQDVFVSCSECNEAGMEIWTTTTPALNSRNKIAEFTMIKIKCPICRKETKHFGNDDYGLSVAQRRAWVSWNNINHEEKDAN